MNTKEMLKQAENDWCTYKTCDLYYNISTGFVDVDGVLWNGKAFPKLNDLLELTDWEKVVKTYTFNRGDYIKIDGQIYVLYRTYGKDSLVNWTLVSMNNGNKWTNPIQTATDYLQLNQEGLNKWLWTYKEYPFEHFPRDNYKVNVEIVRKENVGF